MPLFWVFAKDLPLLVSDRLDGEIELSKTWLEFGGAVFRCELRSVCPLADGPLPHDSPVLFAALEEVYQLD